MSHRVDPHDLAATAARYGSTPFLLHTSDSGTVRANHVHAIITDGPTPTVRCSSVGRSLLNHARSGGAVTILWPPREEGDFSLIADGTSEADGDVVLVRISDAVLHRPAPTDGSPASC